MDRPAALLFSSCGITGRCAEEDAFDVDVDVEEIFVKVRFRDF